MVPYFSVGFSRFLCFDQIAAILVHYHSSECNLERVSKVPRGWESRAAIGITAIVYWCMNLHQSYNFASLSSKLQKDL